MVTTQAAFNSFDRVMRYIGQFTSDSTLYSKSVEHLNSLKSMALELVDAVNQQLGYEDEVQIDKKNLTQEIVGILQSMDLIKEDAARIPQPVEVIEEVKPVEVESKAQVPNTIIRDYKSVAYEVASLDDDIYSDESVSRCSQLCNEYLQARFDMNNDPNNIHKFSKREIRNYVASLILWYSDCIENDDIDKFELDFYNWIERVGRGSEKYTLPKPAAAIFFEIKKNGKVELPDGVKLKARSIWNELWLKGYNKLHSDNELSPTYDMEWLFKDDLNEVFLIESKGAIDESYRNDVIDSWRRLYTSSKLRGYTDRWYNLVKKNQRYYELIDTNTSAISAQSSVNIVLSYLTYLNGDCSRLVEDMDKLSESFINSEPDMDILLSMLDSHLGN